MATASKLAPHMVPEHMDFDKLSDWAPKSIKIVDFDDEKCRRAYEANPNALFILRDWALSEQKDDVKRDPEGTGRRHAEEMAAKSTGPIPLAQTVLLGINEPDVWTGIDPWVRYSVAYLDRLWELGRQGGALNLSVGWPADMGVPDSPVNWAPYEDVRKAIVRGGHYLVLHEYWDISGPGDMWRWWAGRYLQCPWDVPIIIGECGVDRYVRGDQYKGESRGWTIWLSQEAYMAQLAWYDQQLLKDPRIHSATIFTFDYARPWGVFDIRPIRDLIIAYTSSVQAVTPQPVTLEQLLWREFGGQFADLRSSLPVHIGMAYDSRPLSAITTSIVHHSATPQDTTWTAIAAYHVGRDWAGIGYHLGVEPDGNVVYVGDILTARAHAEGHNTESVGICCLGNYETDQPSEAMLSSLKRLLAVVNAYCGKTLAQNGHKDVNSGTECPGNNLYAALWPAQPPVQPPAPDRPTDATVRNLAWQSLYPDGIPYNPDAALYKLAKENGSGLPVTHERYFQADGTPDGNADWVLQGYAKHVLYTKRGEWDTCYTVEWL